MKSETRKAIDLAIDDYNEDIITALTDTVVSKHVAGDLIAYKNLGLPVIDLKVQESALEFGKKYSKLLRDEGAGKYWR